MVKVSVGIIHGRKRHELQFGAQFPKGIKLFFPQLNLLHVIVEADPWV